MDGDDVLVRLYNHNRRASQSLSCTVVMCDGGLTSSKLPLLLDMNRLDTEQSLEDKLVFEDSSH